MGQKPKASKVPEAPMANMVQGMKISCIGSRDKTRPKDSSWMTVRRRLFFGLDHTKTWGRGGVAFLNPEISIDDKAHMHIYRITLQQFNDVMLQENGHTRLETVFGSGDLEKIVNKKSFIAPLKFNRYHNILYLGTEKNVPILTVTCTPADMERFKRKQLPTNRPAKKYADTLVKALVKGKRLTKQKAQAYIKEASTKPLVASRPPN